MKMAYEKRKSMYGYCFIALWFVGALIFFLIPVVESLLYSFQEITPDTGGKRPRIRCGLFVLRAHKERIVLL